jgi:hypothetical protein
LTVHQLITDGYGVNSNLILEGYTARGSVFRDVLVQLKKVDPAPSCWESEVWEPGIWLEGDSVFQQVLRELKQ